MFVYVMQSYQEEPVWTEVHTIPGSSSNTY